MSDEEIIALYFARDEQALAQTDAKYAPIASPWPMPSCPAGRTQRRP